MSPTNMLPDESRYEDVLRHFPAVDFAFAYGSGAVRQAGYRYEEGGEMPMLDVIFAVQDPLKWHLENYRMNSEHYTCTLDVNWMVRQIQGVDASGPALWFNVDVSMDNLGFPGRRMKYGVVSVKHLLQDLEKWSCLYIAGRLHKPLHIIQYNEAIMNATRLNRMFAVKTALMLLPPTFNETQLYTTIAGLSYMGDQRMTYGAENLNKVDNLVVAKVPSFRELYKFPLERVGTEVNLKSWQDQDNATQYSQDTSLLSTRLQQDNFLPLHLQFIIHQQLAGGSQASSMKQLSCAASSSQKKIVQNAISHIVSRAAGRQTLVNLACVGLGKGVSYLFAKVMKRIKSSK